MIDPGILFEVQKEAILIREIFCTFVLILACYNFKIPRSAGQTLCPSYSSLRSNLRSSMLCLPEVLIIRRTSCRDSLSIWQFCSSFLVNVLLRRIAIQVASISNFANVHSTTTCHYLADVKHQRLSQCCRCLAHTA